MLLQDPDEDAKLATCPPTSVSQPRLGAPASVLQPPQMFMIADSRQKEQMEVRGQMEVPEQMDFLQLQPSGQLMIGHLQEDKPAESGRMTELQHQLQQQQLQQQQPVIPYYQSVIRGGYKVPF